MNLRSNWCLFGFLTWVAMAGMASAQPEGSVRLGTPADGQLPPPLTTFNGDMGQVNLGGTGPGNYSNYDRTFRPRINVDTRGGGLYGYEPGYTNLGMFLPYTIEDNTAILFGDVRAIITHTGKGGANVGAGWRWWMEDLDRIVGLSAWYDFDAGHVHSYDQIGLSFESLGRFVDFRTNGYMPIGKRDHMLGTVLDSTNTNFIGNGLFFNRTTSAEQTYTGFDTEVGGPVPLLGRYGVNGYLGGYHFVGNGQLGGSVTGVSTRLMAQVNEDVSVGVQLTDDNVFGTNVQAQVFVTLPEGTPSRWLRNPRVQDRLTSSVFRQFRVMAKVDTFDVPEAAINPKDGLPYFVTHIDPNGAATGTGKFGNPLNSIAAYNNLSLAQRQQSDIIYVRPRTDDTNTNLDTGATLGTLTLFNGQRLLSTSVQNQFASNVITGGFGFLPGFVAGAELPNIFNSTGGNVVTLAPNATQCIEVSGFDITGSATGNGIQGSNNTWVAITNNDIHDALNGVLLTNTTGVGGMAAVISDNSFHDNLNDGFRLVNTAAAPLELRMLGNSAIDNGDDGAEITVTGGGPLVLTVGETTNADGTTKNPSVYSSNGDNGMEINVTNSTIAGRIADSTFNQNTNDGLRMDLDASTANFRDPLLGYAITGNEFAANTGSGVEINAINASTLGLSITANNFGTTGLQGTGNQDDGLRISADSGVTVIDIGGATSADGNVFTGNLENGVVLNLTGNSDNTLDIGFNTISLAGGGGGGNIFLTGHDVDLHLGQNDFDTIILDFLRGVGTTNVIPEDQYSLAVLGNGVGFWGFTGGTFGAPLLTKPGYQSTTFFDLDTLAATPALWDQVFANDGIIILSHVSCGGCDVTDAGVTAVNSQAARFATAISSGTDVWANAGADNANYYNFLPAGVVATGVPLFGINGFVATPAGIAIGITDLSLATSMINGNLTHNSFAMADPAFTVFETRTLGGVTENISIGVQNAQLDAGGFVTGAGTDGIRVNLEDTAFLRPTTIHDNTVNGYGSNGIHVVANDLSQIPDLTVTRNTVSGSGNGITLERNDSALLNAIVMGNTATGGTFAGLNVVATGTDLPNVSVSVSDNTFTGNDGSGMSFNASDAAVLLVEGDRNLVADNTGHGLSYTGDGTARIVSLLRNITATGNTLNGLDVLSRGASDLNLTFTSPFDPLLDLTNPLVTARTSFSQNGQNGLFVATRDTSLVTLTLDEVDANENTLNGLSVNRQGASLFLGTASNSSFSDNTVNGILFTGLGSDPADPNQPLSGTANELVLTDVVVNGNGTATTFGNGFRADLFGDAPLVLTATTTEFVGNAGNGIRVEIAPGAEFGDGINGPRSILDGVTITDNAQNGIQVVSNISVTPASDANSLTFLDINANSGDTLIANNGLNGVLLQYPGGVHDVRIFGDTDPTVPTFTTTISANGQDGIHADIGLFATATLTVDDVTVGGIAAADGNANDGIDFEVTSRMQVLDGANTFNQTFNAAGVGTLVVNNSRIRNNGAHGLNLIGQGLNSNGIAFNAEPFQNFDSDPFGVINASVTGTTITDNALNGVNIDIRGAMGGDHRNFSTPNQLFFAANLIASNGRHGVFLESNAGQQIRGGNTHRRIAFGDPQPTNPAFPYDPNNLAGTPDWNTGDNVTILGGAFLSNYMNLQTEQATDLVFTNNVVQFNGTQTVVGDGVYVRVGTGSYLSADIRDNTIVGNLQNDVHLESFVAYNRQTNAIINPPVSVAANPGPDIVFLDDTAQLDLRLTGNTGNTINIVSPFNNGGGLPGNVTPNGAFYPGDFFKNNFGTNVQPRLAQLFQIDDGLAGVNAPINSFIANGVTTDVSNTFSNASWHLRAAPDAFFPNPLFPEDFFTDPGDPFLP